MVYRNIVFFSPSKITGGAEYYFIRLAEYVADNFKDFVSAVKLPFVNVTFFVLFANVKAVPSVGSAVIPLAAKSAKATSFVKP